jgi:hypothetical protein
MFYQIIPLTEEEFREQIICCAMDQDIHQIALSMIAVFYCRWILLSHVTMQLLRVL